MLPRARRGQGITIRRVNQIAGMAIPGLIFFQVDLGVLGKVTI